METDMLSPCCFSAEEHLGALHRGVWEGYRHIVKDEFPHSAGFEADVLVRVSISVDRRDRRSHDWRKT